MLSKRNDRVKSRSTKMIHHLRAKGNASAKAGSTGQSSNGMAPRSESSQAAHPSGGPPTQKQEEGEAASAGAKRKLAMHSGMRSGLQGALEATLHGPLKDLLSVPSVPRALRLAP